MDGVVREVNSRVLGKWPELLSVNGGRFEIDQLLFAVDKALVADSEVKLCGLMSEFAIVCERIKSISSNASLTEGETFPCQLVPRHLTIRDLPVLISTSPPSPRNLRVPIRAAHPQRGRGAPGQAVPGGELDGATPDDAHQAPCVPSLGHALYPT